MPKKTPLDYKNALLSSDKSIYTPIEIGDPNYWIPTAHLEKLLNDGMRGLSVLGLPIRTRSKIVKTAVCNALGYPTPTSFARTKPRFVGQQLDIYTQKAMNLQVWNDELSPTRRYAIIQVSKDYLILKVKVVNGQELALLDTTGTITTKYQARLDIRGMTHELISSLDTAPMQRFVSSGSSISANTSPIDEPEDGVIFSINTIFQKLSLLVGRSFADPGADQERNRGAELHRLICECLGYRHYEDKGQFPDIRHQLLEVKLQTSKTIDLGLVLPNSEAHLDIQQLDHYQVRHCDTRYAIFYAETDGKDVKLTHLFVSTGADFFNRFQRFEGKIKNRKIQIPLPRSFFES